MKLQQLKFLVSVAEHDLNISTAAEVLYTSQPGVSKQIRLLEEELNIQIFIRSGKQLTDVTPAGKKVLKIAKEILQSAKNMKAIAAEFKDQSKGVLNIATTHTQARYALPKVITEFRQKYPEVSLHIHQGSPSQISELVTSGEVDFAISTEDPKLFEDLISMPCYQWNRCALVPKDHPLTQIKSITLADIIQYSLVTYVFAWSDASPIQRAFNAQGLEPKIAFSATDADVIKEYVRLGLGVGLVARMAYLPEKDQDLVAIPLEHLFDWSTTYICMRPYVALRGYMYDFIEKFSSHLTKDLVVKSEQALSSADVAAIFQHVVLPKY